MGRQTAGCGGAGLSGPAEGSFIGRRRDSSGNCIVSMSTPAGTQRKIRRGSIAQGSRRQGLGGAFWGRPGGGVPIERAEAAPAEPCWVARARFPGVTSPRLLRSDRPQTRAVAGCAAVRRGRISRSAPAWPSRHRAHESAYWESPPDTTPADLTSPRLLGDAAQWWLGRPPRVASGPRCSRRPSPGRRR
jgi:hypothetical protein